VFENCYQWYNVIKYINNDSIIHKYQTSIVHYENTDRFQKKISSFYIEIVKP